jgi:hypothetical protein
MANQTWTTTIISETEPDDFIGMRKWLRENGLPVPSRNDDVLARFIWATIGSNALWEGVFSEFRVKRPTRLKGPWEYDYDEWPEFTDPPSRIPQLAIGSFGLLVMLAALFTAGAGACRHSPTGTPLCYNVNRVIDTARDTLSSSLAVR